MVKFVPSPRTTSRKHTHIYKHTYGKHTTVCKEDTQLFATAVTRRADLGGRCGHSRNWCRLTAASFVVCRLYAARECDCTSLQNHSTKVTTMRYNAHAVRCSSFSSCTRKLGPLRLHIYVYSINTITMASHAIHCRWCVVFCTYICIYFNSPNLKRYAHHTAFPTRKISSRPNNTAIYLLVFAVLRSP